MILTHPLRILLHLLLTVSAPLAGADAELGKAIDAVTPDIVALRHRLHENPELSNREVETAKVLAAHLRALGMEVETEVALTGVVGILRGDRQGPVVAIRADIDALPVTEETGFGFSSKVRSTYLGKEVGVAHACGHDIHMAVQLGVASVLAGMRETLPGTVKFIFQPAEEGAPPGERGGAEVMLEEGVFDNPRPAAIFALHAFPDWNVGQVAYVSGPIYASSDRFRVVIKGRQIHGAYPHLGVDPIVLAAQTILAFQTIPSRSLNPLHPAVVTVGTIGGGERFNIIPGQVEFTGTVRAFGTDVQALIERRMAEILAGTAAAAGAGYELEYQRITPYTNNDPDLSAWAKKSLIGALGAESVIDAPRTMGAEDFAFFANEIPGFYFRLGTLKPGTESGGLHTPNFRADDGAIPVGIRAMSQLVLDFLRAPPDAI